VLHIQSALKGKKQTFYYYANIYSGTSWKKFKTSVPQDLRAKSDQCGSEQSKRLYEGEDTYVE
jgi:hypothetical protein